MGGLGSALSPLGDVGSVSAPANPLDITIIQGLGVTPGLDVLIGKNALISDVIDISSSLTPYIGLVLRESIRIALTQSANQIGNLTVADQIRLASKLTPGVPAALAETIGMALSQVVAQSIKIIDKLGIHDTLAPAFIYNLSLSEQARFTDALLKFLGASVTDTISISPSMSGIAARNATLSDVIQLQSDLSPQLLLNVVLADNVDLTDEQLINMIFAPELIDGVAITGAYLSPGGGITTWAMNTRNVSISEYTNYAFNSFGQMGHKYVGANDTGLYELLGDTDNGTAIIADIKSGLAQWAESRFSMFDNVYLAVRGGGDFVLKIITGDGQTYIYSFTAQDMRTTKIRTGKGLRARYFAFELISTGQDFDLDSIEFVPIASSRRV